MSIGVATPRAKRSGRCPRVDAVGLHFQSEGVFEPLLSRGRCIGRVVNHGRNGRSVGYGRTTLKCLGEQAIELGVPVVEVAHKRR